MLPHVTFIRFMEQGHDSIVRHCAYLHTVVLVDATS